MFIAALALHFVADVLFKQTLFSNYFDDFLAPALLLSIVSFLSAHTGVGWLVTRAGTLSVLLFAVVVWEGIAPLALEQSTADWVDIAAYCLGAAVFRAVFWVAGGITGSSETD